MASSITVFKPSKMSSRPVKRLFVDLLTIQCVFVLVGTMVPSYQQPCRKHKQQSIPALTWAA